MEDVALFYQPTIFQTFDSLLGVQSKRHGGVSSKPYQSLNLGLNTDDNHKNVTENRKRLFSALNIQEEQIAAVYQVHGNEVLEVSNATYTKGYDALITQQKNVFLAVTVADCVPVLIYDKSAQAVAAIHAGWRGTSKSIIKKTLEKMSSRYGTNPGDCYVYIGTCIDECSFEVDEDVAKYFLTQHKRWDKEKNKFFVDLKKANEHQLLQCGVPKKQIEISPYSTVLHNSEYFSYRKENGKTGRMLAIIGMRKVNTTSI